MARSVESFLNGRWQSGTDGRPVRSAVNGRVVAEVSAQGLDQAAARSYAITTGGGALRALTFHQRAAILRNLGKALLAETDELYALSCETGATAADSAIDIDGGAGALLSYAAMGRKELPNRTVWPDGDPISLSRDGRFVAQHLNVSRLGVALQINAFNFPCWGMLEKFAPAFLAGVPTIVKPATPTAYLTEAMVRLIDRTGLVPDGALQMIAGDITALLDVLDEQDSISFTGSAATARQLRSNPAVVDRGTRFTAEADSLNAAVLLPSAGNDGPTFELFIETVASELRVKAGQKCTAIRRIIVPASACSAVEEALVERLTTFRIGDPADPATEMGPLVGLEQRTALQQAIEQIGATVVHETTPFGDVDVEHGAFVSPVLLRAETPAESAAHQIEPFGPVATLMAYDTLTDAVDLVARGRGSLVTSVVGPDLTEAADLTLGLAPYHGRLHVVDATSGPSSTGHGSPVPQLVHGGPGRAGGGEELGGMRSLLTHMQRTAVQGSPDLLTAVTGRWFDGARRQERGHPFTFHFEDLAVGDSLQTESRRITIEDIERFAELTGDTFYAHMDEQAAAASPIFSGRVAHGYFVLSAAAGLFVWPDPGPVLANYGLDNLRFATPTYPGAEIRVVLTCKEKSLRPDAGYGEVRWDTKVLDQNDNLLAAYDVLTMVATREGN